VESRRNVVPIGQRDQSAAALPILGRFFETAEKRFALRDAFETRAVVLGSSIENG
jgi:hypothetical protein